MPLTNPYNPYTPYTAGLPTNQYLPTIPNNTSGIPTYQPQYQTQYTPPAQQPSMPQQSIFGRMVTEESEIKPNEVPMDGTIAFFPRVDLSAIIAKQWVQDGTIKTVTFTPVIQEPSPETHSMSIDELAQSMDSRFNELKSMIKYRNGGRGGQKNSSDTKESSNE